MDENLDMEWGKYGCQMKGGVYVQRGGGQRRRRRRGWTRASVYIFCCVCLFWLTFCDFIELPMTEVFMQQSSSYTARAQCWLYVLLTSQVIMFSITFANGCVMEIEWSSFIVIDIRRCRCCGWIETVNERREKKSQLEAEGGGVGGSKINMKRWIWLIMTQLIDVLVSCRQLR